MESVIHDSTASIEQLLARGFEMPIHFVAMGANGAIFAGSIDFSGNGHGLDCKMTVQPEDEGLTAPVNIMYVDRKGEAALVGVRSKGRINRSID